MRSELLSVAIFAATAGVTAYAALQGRSQPAAGTCDVNTYFTIARGQDLQLIIPAGPHDQVDLLSVVELQPELEPGIEPAIEPDVESDKDAAHPATPAIDGAGAGPGADPTDVVYGFTARWYDNAEQALGEQEIWEHSTIEAPVNVPLGPPAPPAASRRVLTDIRRSQLDASGLKGRGGILSIRYAGDGWMHVRAFVDDERADMEREQLAYAPGAQVEASVIRQAGVDSWERLSWEERTRSVRRVRQILGARGRIDVDLHREHLTLCPTADPTVADLAHHLVPGQRLAINLRGPVTVALVSFDDPSVLAAWPIPAGAGPLDEVSALPGDLPTTAPARLLRLPGEGPASLHLENRGDAPITFQVVTLTDRVAEGDENIGTRTTFGRTPVAPIEIPESDRDDESSAHALTALGVEWRTTAVAVVGIESRLTADFETEPTDLTPAMRVRLRPVLESAADVRPRTVRISGIDEEGGVLWSETARVEAHVSRYERLFAADTRTPPEWSSDPAWVGEPVNLYVYPAPGTHWLRVDADTPVLVSGSVQGPPWGADATYPTVTDPTVHLRYPRRPTTSWHAIEPFNEAQLVDASQRVDLALNVRLEPYLDDDDDDDDDDGTVGRHGGGAKEYASLEPRGPVAERRVFLKPAGPADGEPRSYYCMVLPGEQPQTFAFDPAGSGGMVEGQLWAPPEAIGSPFTIDLDGTPWQADVIRQTTTGLRTFGHGALSTVRFSAPSASRLWLRTETIAIPCSSAHVTVSAFGVAPHQSLTFQVPDVQPPVLVSVAGFAAGATSFALAIDHGRPARRGGIFASRSPARRVVSLLPTGDAGRVLGDAQHLTDVLAAKAIRLGESLFPGDHTLTVTNLSDRYVFVRATKERLEPEPTEHPWRPRLILEHQTALVSGGDVLDDPAGSAVPQAAGAPPLDGHGGP